MTENSPKSAEELAADIRATRRRLAATIETLTARTDVRTRARARMTFERRLRTVRETGGRIRARLRRGGHGT
ncbi:MAG TPA: DUF3618 domain-containing protein [Actinospica sp.]|jgi:hypothetical protein|nr:DUF3618 domain-containing protein [Actinospica sp.]